MATDDAKGPERLDDEQLLEELYRRFGAGWCSFSAMVRERGVCPVCDGLVALTRHHLRPIARGAGKEVEIRRRYVDLCRPCHDLAHRVWGPGDRWEGPIEREIFVDRLRARRVGREPQLPKRRSKPRILRFFSRLLSLRRRS
ncbi:MAG: hypothetical protein H6807_17820 [Planctomycetes bacterium]|nr:hypothetical protein [Planctomycetota bacterium]